MVRLHPSGPARQHDDPLRHADGFADVVRDEDRGLALAAQDLGDLVRQREPRLRIERRKRLVEQHDVRLGAQRARQRHALAHAARELARQVVQELAEPVAGEQLRRALARLGHVGALDFRAQHRVFEDGAPLEQIILLQHVADLAARPGHRLAVDQHGAAGRLEDAGDQRQQRALAAAALADDGDELAGRDRDRDALERLGLALEAEIAQADVAQLDLGRGGNCRCRHGSLRLVGELGEHQVLELHALAPAPARGPAPGCPGTSRSAPARSPARSSRSSACGSVRRTPPAPSGSRPGRTARAP